MTTITQDSAVLIGGQWTPSLDGRTVPVISPATEEPVAHVTLGGAQDMERRDPRRPRGVRRGPVAADDPARARARCSRATGLLMERPREIAETLTAGGRDRRIKPDDAPQRVTNVRDLLDVHVALGRDLPVGGDPRRHALAGGDPPGAGRRRRRRSCRGTSRCHGDVKLAPALLAGCTVVVKPAPETPLDAYLLAEPLDRGRPARRASSTSSPPAARSASTSCATPASTRSLHRLDRGRPAHRARSAASSSSACTLELGGKSAAIILDDADLDATIARCCRRAS